MAEGKKDITFGKIGNALKSVAADHVTAFAEDVFDETRQGYQSEINQTLQNEIEEETNRAKAAEEANAAAIAAEEEARDIAINNEAQERAKNDENLNKAIVAESDRAKAAEEANTQAIAKRGIYDVSAYNGGAVFESLSALLNNANLSTLIPTSVRCGGMSIRFIQGSVPNSDNKYVQARCMAQNFTTDVTQWQEVDGELKFGSKNLIENGTVKIAQNVLQESLSGNIIDTIAPQEKITVPILGYWASGNIYYENGQITRNDTSTRIYFNKALKLPKDTVIAPKDANYEVSLLVCKNGVYTNIYWTSSITLNQDYDEVYVNLRRSDNYDLWYPQAEDGIIGVNISVPNIIYNNTGIIKDLGGQIVNYTSTQKWFMDYTRGNYKINLEGSSNCYCTGFIPVKKGDVLTVKSTTNQNTPVWYFPDNDETLVIPETNAVSSGMSVDNQFVMQKDGYILVWGRIEYDFIVSVTSQSVTDKVDKMEQQIEELKNNIIVVQPSIIPPLPYKVYKNNGVYSVEDILNKKELDTFTNYYIDSINGSDSNDGSQNAPFKTFQKAINLFVTNSNPCHIHIVGDSLFYSDSLYTQSNGNIAVTKSLVITCDEGKFKLIGGKNPIDIGWVQYSGDTYVSGTLTDVGCVVDMNSNNIDKYGLYKGYTEQNSIQDVVDTQGSYYVDTTNNIVYTHITSGSSISQVTVLDNKDHLRFTLYGSTSKFLYIQGANIIGNTYIESSDHQSSVIDEIIFKDCISQHCWYNDNAFGLWDADYIYAINCIGGYVKNDIFNYHAAHRSNPNNVVCVEVNCIGEYAGWYKRNGYSENISTAHDGVNILRCNTLGMQNKGNLIMDIDGCYTAMYDCTVYNDAFDGNVNCCIGSEHRTAGYSGRDSILMIENCHCYDTRTNISVKAEVLYIKNMELSNIMYNKEIVIM